MNLKKYIVLAVMSAAVASLYAGDRYGIVPNPRSLDAKEGAFEPDGRIAVYYGTEAEKEIAAALCGDLTRLYGTVCEPVRARKNRKGGISVTVDEGVDDEAYRLGISPDGISLKGSSAGAFYGTRTLLQLAAEKDGRIVFPCVEIDDSPRFGYRGVLLDVARYYYPVDVIKSLLDRMALFKLNRFHWHLTEDSGWRIEIRKYPLLTEIGAWRGRTMLERNPDKFDDLPHGGFYTQDEIRDIVAYAARLNIEVIPEIDMPGHIMSALAGYPHLSCTGDKVRVRDYWKIQEDILCAGREEVYDFLWDVLDEILELFPSEVIHVGGDEAPKTRWKECAACQARMKEEGLADEHELQIYFTRRVGEYLASRGRKMLGWDGYIVPGSIPSAMVMGWQNVNGGTEAAAAGHQVVMSPHQYMYFDYYQGDPANEPHSIGGHIPLSKAYHYEPVSPELPEEFHDRVIGVQGNLWCEYIHSATHLEYMAFPRLLALSEIGWSQPQKDYEGFLARMASPLAMLDADGVNARLPEPLGLQDTETDRDRVTVALTPLKGMRLIYTVDGSEPLDAGTYYTGPVEIDLSQGPVTLKCVVKAPSGRVSRTYRAIYRKAGADTAHATDSENQRAQ